MKEQFERTAMLIGEKSVDRLQGCHVAIFGVGGVGGYVCEALARSGIEKFDLIDMDTVSMSNINRQIIATTSTVGRYKTEVMRERMLDINPEIQVNIHNCFFLEDTKQKFNFEEYDYVVDAVDTVTAKLLLAEVCTEKNIPIISSMGAGNKLDPTAFKVADINKTSVCPLAKVMRRELKNRGIKKLKVVYSEEKAMTPYEIKNTGASSETFNLKKRSTPGSIAFVPSVVGLIIASEVIKDLIAE